MADTNFRTVLTAGIIFAIIFTGIITALTMVSTGSELAKNTSDERSTAVVGFIQNDELTNFTHSFDKMDNTISNINNVSASLSKARVGQPNFATLALAFVSGTWDSIKIIFGMFGFVTDIFTSFNAWFGLGDIGWIIPLITALVGIMIIFGIINYIFGRGD